MRVTATQLKQIVGGKAPYAAEAAEAFTQYSDQFGFTTTLRTAHFWAQIGHESARLTAVKEIWGPTKAQSGYEGRRDLGNTQPGDGKRFMGHSLLQVTGRANHRDCTKWLRDRGIDCPDFEQEPEKLMEFPWAIMGAFWYWETRKINVLADKDDVLAVSIKINGKNKTTGLPNGYEDRKALLAKAKKVFNVVPTLIPKKPTVKKPKVYDESLLTRSEVQYVQERLITLGYHEVGIADGIWGPKAETAVRLLQTRANDMGTPTIIDGHYGPQTKNLIDPIYGDKYRKLIEGNRANASVKYLAQQGNPGVVKGRNIKFASILGVISSVAAAAYAASQAPTDLPPGSSIFLAFMPPGAAAVISAIGPYLITFGVSLYTTYKGQGVVDSSVERFREGIDNSGLPPQLNHNLGGIFNRIFR